ncbi:hypothetical protein [Sphingobium yanoikuyae]|uniref:hypothetical protein n=1 Tax=Sphingobium yanoikuyae TaxID=13690 RepID=UPI0028AF4635|nr:hypothetical protein [Sphingobium yanoikuyae]
MEAVPQFHAAPWRFSRPVSLHCRLAVASLSRRKRVALTRLSRDCRFTGAGQAHWAGIGLTTL